jgi:transglutaminase-like putative cysteine protease
MKLKITHSTTFVYDEPVSEAYMEMRLTPLNAGGQRCESFRLVTDPPGEVRGYTDRFGNRVRNFDTIAPHATLVVSARSEVVTPEGYADPQRSLSMLDAYDYLQPTDYTPQTDDVRDFARTCQQHGACGDDAAAVAHTVMRAVNRVLAYVPGATNVRTTAHEALLRGRGVCQDFAHLMIATCRAAGLPARYVSGYIFSPRRGTGAATHAWTDVFIEDRGWISLDPTHECAQTDHYVRLAVGRDYADVPPTRGVYKGMGEEAMNVDVLVETG